MKIKYCLLGLYLLQNIWYITCFDPFTIGAIVSAGIAIVGFMNQNNVIDKRSMTNTVLGVLQRLAKKGCQIIGQCEGCEDYWIPGNMEGLETDLKNNVFGQTLAINIVLQSMKHHLNRKDPTKALVLSFHGSPGVGKNFVGQYILRNLFKNGEDTNYVHFFRGAIDFTVKKEAKEYKEFIKEIIESKVEECNRSIFLFDEVDKIPNGVLDVLVPYLKNNAKFDGVDYRRTIFIFLSNLGTKAISDKVIDLWRKGQSREEFDAFEFRDVIQKAITENKAGSDLKYLHNRGLINYLVPFLPLEKKHIWQCLERDVESQNQIMSDELYNQVISTLTFVPEDKQLFATNGCKLVGEKAAHLIERELFRKKSNTQRF